MLNNGLNRRNFFSSLAGLFGIGTVAKAAQSKQSDRYGPLLPINSVGSWRYDWVEVISKKLEKKGLDTFSQPNPHETWNSFFRQAGNQLEHTGMALIWMVPNALSNVCELHVIPTDFAVPRPAINPDYPDGYYHVCPIYYKNESGRLTWDWKPPVMYTCCGSAIIPAQWMLRIQSPYWLEEQCQKMETNLIYPSTVLDFSKK